MWYAMHHKSSIEKKSFKNTRVLIMAGGTGGHIFPALAVAAVLQKEGAIVHWIGSKGGLEETLIPPTGIPLHLIGVQGLRGRSLKNWVTAPFMLLKVFLQVAQLFRKLKPQLCLGMGGFAAGPGGVMAWLTRTPLVIHEQNAIAGFTNRCLAPLSKKVLCGFPGAFGEHTRDAVIVGNPVRPEILALSGKKTRPSNPALKVLILGGSRGAQALNECVPKAFSLLPPDKRPLIWHQTGEKGFVETQALYSEAGDMTKVQVMPFIENMQKAYAWADLVVCRAGALTIAEITSVGLPSILVPYPWAVDDHQTANARILVELGAAQCVQQAVLTPDWLAQQWVSFQKKPQELTKMRLAASQMPLNEATTRIVQHCQAVLAC
jgi:UDP-N-acetylglucosamine--N-acetylmuramyl-(pentapeptide) pyrophosphoryl-undecaprenol N-acetylglucosamine transferase